MKRLYPLFIACSVLFFPSVIRAQSFNVVYDTVYVTPGGDTTVTNEINNLTTSAINVNWKIAATNFPAGWEPGSAICDNNVCYYASALWPSASVHNTSPCIPGLNGYRVILDLSTLPATGVYYFTVMMHNTAIPADSASETYITRMGSATTAVSTVTEVNKDVLLYPNPAQDELNIVYGTSADVKTIAVYNIIGKIMTVYKVTDNNSANLNLVNIPPGFYFVRLVDSHGGVVTTRKFTKQ